MNIGWLIAALRTIFTFFDRIVAMWLPPAALVGWINAVNNRHVAHTAAVEPRVVHDFGQHMREPNIIVAMLQEPGALSGFVRGLPDVHC